MGNEGWIVIGAVAATLVVAIAIGESGATPAAQTDVTAKPAAVAADISTGPWWVARAVQPGNCFDATSEAQQRISKQRGYLTWRRNPAGDVTTVETIGDAGRTVTYYHSKSNCDAIDLAIVPAGTGFGDVTVQDGK
jgi:hypothetical protein